MIEDMRNVGIPGRRLRDKSKPNIARSTNFGRHLLNRITDISCKMGFATDSEFIRYAVRKELDYQAELLYVPQIKKEYGV